MFEISKEEKSQIKEWLNKSFVAANKFDGSESSEERFYGDLALFDNFVRAHNNGESSAKLEQDVTNMAFPDHPMDMPETVDGFLDIVLGFYDNLKNVDQSVDISEILEKSGAVVRHSDKVFVQTDGGSLRKAESDNNNYEFKTQPRLVMLLEHLRNNGVYMDDLSVIFGKPDPKMIRKLPYNIVQIPKHDAEIAVCDQVGEKTFVKKGAIGEMLWSYLKKSELNAREDITPVKFNNEDSWKAGISAVLFSDDSPSPKKVNVNRWVGKATKLDIKLIKDSLLEHRLATGEWLKNYAKEGDDGTKGSYILRHGVIADGKLSATSLNGCLLLCNRGIVKKTSIAQLNEEVSDEHGFDYKNKARLSHLDINDIKSSLLVHYYATEEALSSSKKEDENGIKGSYILCHGALADGKFKVASLENSLRRDGSRGLTGKSSIIKEYQIIVDELGVTCDKTKKMFDMKDKLGAVMSVFKADLLEYFDGDKKSAYECANNMNLDSWYSELKKVVNRENTLPPPADDNDYTL